MDRTLFRTTAMVALGVALGATAAHAGQGHHGGMAAPFRPMGGMHGGWAHQGHWAHPGGMASGGYGAQPQVIYGYHGAQMGAGYGHGPAVYPIQGGGQGYGQPYLAPRGGYGMRRPGTGYGGGYGYAQGSGRQTLAQTRTEGRRGYQGGRYGYGYGAAGAVAGAVVGAAAGYGYDAGGYGGGYGYGNGYGGGYDAGYPAPETPLTVTYGEPAAQPVETSGGLFGSGLFATGGYAGDDDQMQDVGYRGPTVAGYGFGGAAGWTPAYPPAGGLAVYSPGAYGPGPRVVTIPSQYRTGGCTCGAPRD